MVKQIKIWFLVSKSLTCFLSYLGKIYQRFFDKLKIEWDKGEFLHQNANDMDIIANFQ